MSSISGHGGFDPAESASLGETSSVNKSDDTSSSKTDGSALTDKLRFIWDKSSKLNSDIGSGAASRRSSLSGSLQSVSSSTTSGKAKKVVSQVLQSVKNLFFSKSDKSNDSREKPELLDVPPPSSPRQLPEFRVGRMVGTGQLPPGFAGAMRELQEKGFHPKTSHASQDSKGGRDQSLGRVRSSTEDYKSVVAELKGKDGNRMGPGMPRPIPPSTLGRPPATNPAVGQKKGAQDKVNNRIGPGVPKPIPPSTAPRISRFNPTYDQRKGAQDKVNNRIGPGVPKPIPPSTAPRISRFNPTYDQRKGAQGGGNNRMGPGVPRPIPPSTSGRPPATNPAVGQKKGAQDKVNNRMGPGMPRPIPPSTSGRPPATNPAVGQKNSLKRRIIKAPLDKS